MEKHTPMMKQYLRIKEENRGALLLFHLGDFYEMFFEDAKTAAEILHITLTSRGQGKNKMPMAGIPCHAAENYIARLVKAGCRVAVCEQTEDPKQSRGLVRREVTRVITPGTVTESPLLEAKSNNYILAFNKKDEVFPLAFADVTTGEFRMTEARDFEEFSGEISRLNPGECIFPEELSDDSRLKKMTGMRDRAYTPSEGWKFSPESAFEELRAHLGVKNLDGLGAGEYPGAAACAGALISYINDTQKTALHHINSLRAYSLSEHMVLDRATQRNLEIVRNLNDGTRAGTLLESMDETVTAAGGRMLKRWLLQPLLEAGRISERQETVSELAEDNFRRKKIREILSGISDMERLMGRISCRRANPRDLVSLKDSLKLINPLKDELGACDSALARKILEGMADVREQAALIEKTITSDPPLALKEGGIIRDGFSRELDALRSVKKDGRDWIARLQTREIERTGINSLRIRYNKIFGYYIEVTKANLENVPEDYTRKQTLVNAERFITPELKEHESRLFNASERITELEYGLFCSLRDEIALKVKEIQATARAVAILDVITGFSETAVNRGYVKPRVGCGDAISIKEGRHPVMELSPDSGGFVANDLNLDSKDNRIIIITGPNMAGKSTYIRQSALLVIMAQLGSFIPAREAEIGVVDRIFTRVGASDDIAGGRSTFMVEMNETANILTNATSRSFIILDEIGRGTSTYDGVSIAWAVVEYLHNHPEVSAKTLFATHYHELTSLSDSLPSVKNLCVLVREWNGEIIFLRKVAGGRTDRSYGIHVARLAGIPEEVIKRARDILGSLEAGAGGVSAEKPSGAGEEAEQLKLFTDRGESKNDEIIEEISGLEIDSLTPVNALNMLARLKEKINGRE